MDGLEPKLYEHLTEVNDDSLDDSFSINNSHNSDSEVNRYLADVNQKFVPGLSFENCIKHYEIMTNGEDLESRDYAKNLFIKSCLKLVVKLAYKYKQANKFKKGNKGLTFIDIIQEGNLGLLDAVQKYNPHKFLPKEVKFSSYAAYWINHYIQRAIFNQGNTVRIPVQVKHDLIKVKKAADAFRNASGIMPKVDELSQTTGLTKERINYILSNKAELLSLDAPFDEDAKDSEELYHYLKDDLVGTPEQHSICKSLEESVQQIIDQELFGVDKQVIRFRFGLNKDGKIYSLEEIGGLLGVTRERIRQREVRSLKKLRCLTVKRQLESYLE